MEETCVALVEVVSVEVAAMTAPVEIKNMKGESVVAPIHRVMAVDFFAFFE